MNGDKLANPGPKCPKVDVIIFDVLNLTQGERDDMYEAIFNLVESRLMYCANPFHFG